MKNFHKLLLITICSVGLANCTHPVTETEVGTGTVLHDSEATPAPEVIESKLPPTELLPNGTFRIGSADAPVHILMFTEHHCDYCRDFHLTYLPELMEKYIQGGQLKLDLAMFKLNKYINSEVGALASFCAAGQEKGYAMHQALFENSSKTRFAVENYAKELELDETAFSKCLESATARELLNKQIALAEEMEIEFVPTFFINGEKLVGLPYEQDLRALIEANLN